MNESNRPKYFEDPKPTDVKACGWQPGQHFHVMKMDPANLHSPWHVVTPGGFVLTFNNNADDAVDEAQANWVAQTLNAALDPKPVAKIHSDGYWTAQPGWSEPLNFSSMLVYAAPASERKS